MFKNHRSYAVRVGAAVVGPGEVLGGALAPVVEVDDAPVVEPKQPKRRKANLSEEDAQ